MLIIRGAYHLWPKRVGFRNDYCVNCRAPRRAVAVRTFDVGHIWGVPLFPVGFWRHWQCAECGGKPHRSFRFRRRILWAGMTTMISLSILFWRVPADSDFAIGAWICRIAAPVGAIFLAVQLMRLMRRPSLRKSLSTVQPAADTVCPFCTKPLITGFGTRWSCPGCGVVRY
jgi:hypothetical protein